LGSGDPANTWVRMYDEDRGCAYFYNQELRETMWAASSSGGETTAPPHAADPTSNPTSIPHAPHASKRVVSWEPVVDDESGHTYYYDAETGAAQWSTPPGSFNLHGSGGGGGRHAGGGRSGSVGSDGSGGGGGGWRADFGAARPVSFGPTSMGRPASMKEFGLDNFASSPVLASSRMKQIGRDGRNDHKRAVQSGSGSMSPPHLPPQVVRVSEVAKKKSPHMRLKRHGSDSEILTALQSKRSLMKAGGRPPGKNKSSAKRWFGFGKGKAPKN
jgi:hypothetical protein